MKKTGQTEKVKEILGKDIYNNIDNKVILYILFSA